MLDIFQCLQCGCWQSNSCIERSAESEESERGADETEHESDEADHGADEAEHEADADVDDTWCGTNLLRFLGNS